MKKLLIAVCIVCIGFFSISYAFNEFSYEKAKGLAQEYIDNSLVGDDNWKENHPTIAGEGKYFYTDSDSPSYVEFKVSCDTTSDCGFIMVNFDGDDVSIPVASTSGNTPSEILIAQNGGNTDDNKLYYFNPFEQYAENQTSGEVSSVDPKDSIENTLRQDTKSTEKEKKQKRKDFKKKLKDRLDTNKKEAGDYKKTGDFKQKRKELKDKKLTIPKDEIGMKILPMASAMVGDSNTSYYIPGTSDKFVPTTAIYSSAYCSGRTPCYDQFKQNYSGTYGTNCWSGCSPTAVAILYGYYDSNGFPNLIIGTAPDYGTGTTVKALVNSLRTYMGTVCNSDYEGATKVGDIPKAKDYAIAMGYKGTTATASIGLTPSEVFSKVKSEIDAGRPIIINVNNSTVGHTVVGFGYKSTGTSYIVRVNMGWGGSSYYSSNGIKYYKSNLDQDLNAFFFNSLNDKKANAVVTFKISK